MCVCVYIHIYVCLCLCLCVLRMHKCPRVLTIRKNIHQNNNLLP